MPIKQFALEWHKDENNKLKETRRVLIRELWEKVCSKKRNDNKLTYHWRVKPRRESLSWKHPTFSPAALPRWWALQNWNQCEDSLMSRKKINFETTYFRYTKFRKEAHLLISGSREDGPAIWNVSDRCNLWMSWEPLKEIKVHVYVDITIKREENYFTTLWKGFTKRRYENKVGTRLTGTHDKRVTVAKRFEKNLRFGWLKFRFRWWGQRGRNFKGLRLL